MASEMLYALRQRRGESGAPSDAPDKQEPEVAPGPQEQIQAIHDKLDQIMEALGIGKEPDPKSTPTMGEQR